MSNTAGAPSGLGGRPRRWLVVLFGVVGAGCGVLLLFTVVAVGIGLVGSLSFGDDVAEVTVETETVAFQLGLPRDVGISDIASPDDAEECPTFFADLGDALTVTAVGESCPIEEGTNRQIGNGDHGTYRTLADVPDPLAVTEVSTDLGRAQVFEQEYFECTNFCNDWKEPVAIVELEHPVDPEFPTLVLRSSKAELSRSELTEIVESLEEPD